MSFQLNNTIKLISKIKLWIPYNYRSYVSRGICAPVLEPKCSKESLAKQKPCRSKLRRLEAGEELPKTVPKNSMWETAECCPDPCPGYVVRFDELYYASSDKSKRKYQQTWTDCPKLQIKQKRLCYHEDIKFAPMEKRIIKRKPQCACPIPNGAPRICIGTLPRKCPKVVTPKCVGGVRPPKCHKEHKHSDCLKECAPYPSYSECMRDKPDPLHPKECKCLDHPKMCEVWAEMRRQMTIKGDDAVNKMLGRASHTD